MSKINRVRFVNFTYNDNRHVYDQTFDFYGGENTLLNLQNGGGKTVLVQMMMQPVSPKQKLKDRLFKSYFMKSSAPTYIMIEWELDNNSGYVLTGIGIKKVSGKNIDDEENDNIKIITFISEYERKNSFDIENISLTYTENDIVRLTDFDKVVKSLSNAEKAGDFKVKLFRWEQAEDKKKYIDELATYKIYQSEWKNLMVKINETEAGLNSFFSDCKTNKALLKTWFIPTIEEQLNKNGKVIENIRELIKNHSEQLVRNEKIIKEKAVFEDFKIKSQQVLDSLMKYDDTLKDIRKLELSIGNLYAYLSHKVNELNEQKDVITAAIKDVDRAVKELLYDKLSFEYHEISSLLSEQQSLVSQIEEENLALKNIIDDYKHKEKIQLCAELNLKLQETEGNARRYRTELDKLELEQEALNRQINDISYTLSLKFDEKVIRDQQALDAEESLRKEKEQTLSNNKDEIKKKRDSIEALNEERSIVKSNMSVFENKEKEVQERYSDFTLQRNFFTGDYNDRDVKEYKGILDTKVRKNISRLQELKSAKTGSEAESKQLEDQINTVIAELRDISVERNEKNNRYKEFLAQKERILKIIREYQLKEEHLFYREKITAALENETNRYNTLIKGWNIDNSLIDNKIKMYETGRSIELSGELQKAFEDNNIDIDFGFEWIRNYAISLEEKEELLRKNPFIPYSIIISKKDFEKLKGLDLKIFTSNTLPLIERESLEERLEIVYANQIVSVDKMNFILSFNNNLMDEEKLNNIIMELKRTKDDYQRRIDEAQASADLIREKIAAVNSFGYTQNQVTELEYDIKSLEDEFNKKTALHSDMQKRSEALKGKIIETDRLIQAGEKEKDALNRQCEDIADLFQKYSAYLDNKAKDTEMNRSISKIKTEINDLEGNYSVLLNEISDLRLKISELTRVLNSSRESLAKYSTYTSGNLIAGEIHELEGELSGLKSGLGSDIKIYRDLLEKSMEEKADCEEKIASYEIPESEYKGVSFDKAELKNIRQAIKDSAIELEKADKKLQGERYKSVEFKERLRIKKEEISRECSGGLPKEPDQIGDIDFPKRSSALLQKKNDLESSQKNTDNEIKRMRDELIALSEYEGLAEKITDINFELIGEDPVIYRRKLIEEYRNKKVSETDQKSGLTSEYDRLESNFVNKADIFRQLFSNLLNDDKKYRWDYGANALERAVLQIDRKLEQYSIDIQKMSDMENHIVNSTFGYVRNVYDEMDSIDKNSVIEIEGERRKMLIISLPGKDKLEENILREYIKGTISNCESLYRQDKPMDNLLTNEINTFDLFDRLVGINKVEIILLKVEPNTVKKKTWKQVIEETSGGERFVSAFVVFISLLTYMRGNTLLKINEDSKVLIMDNPFGPITSEHLLKPLFDIARKYNTQLICLSDLKEHTIYDRFNLVYALNIEKEAGRDEEYIEVKVIKKDLEENSLEDEILTSSMFKVEQQSIFDLIKQDFC